MIATYYLVMDFRILALTIIFVGIFVLVPVIMIMTEHQRKMARIIRGETEDVEALKSEIAALRCELAELKGESYSIPEATQGLRLSGPVHRTKVRQDA